MEVVYTDADASASFDPSATVVASTMAAITKAVDPVVDMAFAATNTAEMVFTALMVVRQQGGLVAAATKGVAKRTMLVEVGWVME